MDSDVTNYNKRIPNRTRICSHSRTRRQLPNRTHSRPRRQLPDDCWYLIFEKLGNKSDRNAFGLTCHAFLDIERSSCKQLQPKEYNKPYTRPFVTDSFIHNMLNRSFRRLESLSLFGCVDLSDSSLTRLLKHGSKMHTLNLSFCFKVTDKGLSYVASGCPSLSSITLYRCRFTDYGLLMLTQSCKSLKHVDLSECFKITDLGISYLNQNCLQLDTLRINGCYKILGESFLGFSPTLARLDANNTNLDSKAVAAALSGGGLRYLNISSPMFPDWGPELAPVGLGGLAANIKFLDFEKCSLVDNDAIEKFSKGCPMLQEWNLSSCYKITILGWESIGSHCQNLEILHVNNCERLCLGGLLYLGIGCARLSVLYMKNCYSIQPYWMDIFKEWRPDVQIRKEEASTKNINPPNWNFDI